MRASITNWAARGMGRNLWRRPTVARRYAFVLGLVAGTHWAPAGVGAAVTLYKSVRVR